MLSRKELKQKLHSLLNEEVVAVVKANPNKGTTKVIIEITIQGRIFRAKGMSRALLHPKQKEGQPPIKPDRFNLAIGFTKAYGRAVGRLLKMYESAMLDLLAEEHVFETAQNFEQEYASI